MNFKIIFILTLSTFLGCEKHPQGENSYAYVGGEIINPNNNYVVLNGPDDSMDTLHLDNNNRFLKKLTDFKSGIYRFMHGGEYQLLFLEPQDSVMVRLNTIDFDESLVFTGEGARKNNYLISTFLENEIANDKFMRMMWDMEPAVFEKALDSNRAKRKADLKEFLETNDFSDYFKTIAETNIDYDYYLNKEMYPFGYYGYNNLIHFKDLPNSFYDFRKDVDYNNDQLLGVIPYTRFLFWHFNNLALKKYYQTATHNVVFDKKSVSYNLEKLKLMDSLVSNENVKNHLLKFTAGDFIFLSDDRAEIDEILNSFLAKSTNESDKEYIQDLANAVKSLESGNPIPNVKLIDYNEKEVDLASLITKPTVIYYWSSNLSVLLRNSHSKAKSLKEKFPGVDFIAINVNDDNVQRWKKTINQHQFPISCEYKFVNPSESMMQLAINSTNKSILVDKDGRIVNRNSMMVTSEFEKELEQVLNNTKEAIK